MKDKKSKILSVDFSVGPVLRHFRQKKRVMAKDLAEVIGVLPPQFTKIENGSQSLSAEQFVTLLTYLNVSFEEVSFLLDGKYLKARNEVKKDLLSLSKKRNKQHMQLLNNNAQAHYKEYRDPYFKHVSCMLQALIMVGETNHDYAQAYEILKPVSDYLSSVETWFEYEIALFINCYYLYPLEKSLEQSRMVLSKIQENDFSIRYNELAHNLFLNLAIYALDEKKHCFDAIDLANRSLLAQSVNSLQTSVTAKVIYQIAHYKLETGVYNQFLLTDIVKGLRLMQFDDFAENILTLLKKHGIILKDI